MYPRKTVSIGVQYNFTHTDSIVKGPYLKQVFLYLLTKQNINGHLIFSFKIQIFSIYSLVSNIN